MRTGYAVKNTVASILVEIITAISGIILPRFFIGVYGSSVYGLVSSIGQFITYMGLVEAGVSAAATVELYEPLANKDQGRINVIVSTAKQFYRRSGVLFVALVLLLIGVYPYIVRNEIADGSFVRLMIVVLSLNGIIDYFILGKYRVLLTADQKTYILALATAVGTLITMLFTIVLILLHCSPILVKSVAAIVYFLRTLFVVWYVRKHYPLLDIGVDASNNSFPQRHSALFHQIVGTICNYTDIILLTIMLRENALVEVSVYSAYNMVGANLSKLFNSICSGVSASFGNIIAQNDRIALHKTFNVFELLCFILLFIIYACMSVLLFSFISLYTASFTDAALYARRELVILFSACGLIQNLRISGLTVLLAAGHYKQTRGAALLEAIINLGLSIILIGKLGIIGVLIGTLAAYLFRSTQTIFYNARYLVQGTLSVTFKRLLRNIAMFALLVVLGCLVLTPLIQSWISWLCYAMLYFVLCSGLFVVFNYLFEPDVVKECISYARSIVRK